MSDRRRTGENAGGSTDQHVTGGYESGTFLTDEPPTARTPAHGSSNAGVNATRANRAVEEETGPPPAEPDISGTGPR